MELDPNKNYGEDPGLLTQNFVDHVKTLIEKKNPGAEAMIFIIYDFIDARHFRYCHDYADGRTPDNSETRRLIQNGTLALHYLMNLTTNFGVKLKAMDPPYHGVAYTDSFKKWHQFWATHYNSLSDSQKNDMMDAIMQDRDLSSFLPEKAWNEE